MLLPSICPKKPSPSFNIRAGVEKTTTLSSGADSYEITFSASGTTSGSIVVAYARYSAGGAANTFGTPTLTCLNNSIYDAPALTAVEANDTDAYAGFYVFDLSTFSAGDSFSLSVPWGSGVVSAGYFLVMEAIGISPSGFHAEATDNDSDPLSVSIDVPQKGMAAAIGVAKNTTGPSYTGCSWTGLTERTDVQSAVTATYGYSSAVNIFGTAQTGLSVSMDVAAITSGRRCMSVISLSPLSGWG
jgi:hypothetical protein